MCSFKCMYVAKKTMEHTPITYNVLLHDLQLLEHFFMPYERHNKRSNLLHNTRSSYRQVTDFLYRSFTVVTASTQLVSFVL